MITSQSQRTDLIPKKARLVSDYALLNGFFHSQIWKLLFTKPSEALYKLCIQFSQANNSLLAYGWTSVSRIKHGSMAGGGVIQMLLVCCFILALNSKLITWKVLSPFAAWFVVPAMPFFKTPDDLYQLAYVQVEGQALVIYGAVFLLASSVNIIISWLGFSNKSVTCRGIGYSYLLADRLFGKHIHVNEFAIYMLECIAVAGIGSYLMVEKIDFFFGVWLITISLAEMRILIYEKTGQIQARRLLDA